jgi:Transposase DDE domain
VSQKQRDEADTDELGEAEPEASSEPEYEFDSEQIIARSPGRKGWLRDAERQLEQHRWQNAERISRSRSERLVLAAERMEADLGAERARNEAFEDHRVNGRDAQERRRADTPTPYQPSELPAGKVNVTDPDTGRLKTRIDYVQGYNAQAVVDEGQIVLAAEITNSTVDWSQLDPMVTATLAELDRADVSERPQTAVADTQYWNEQHMDEVIANKHVQVLIPPDGPSGKRRKGWTGGRYTWMRYVLSSQPGDSLYRKRKHMIEPMFGHTRHNRGVTRFLRRGRSAVRTEWRLLMMTHNLTKVHRHQIATGVARNGPSGGHTTEQTGPSPTPLSAPSDAGDHRLVSSDSLPGNAAVRRAHTCALERLRQPILPLRFLSLAHRGAEASLLCAPGQVPKKKAMSEDEFVGGVGAVRVAFAVVQPGGVGGGVSGGVLDGREPLAAVEQDCDERVPQPVRVHPVDVAVLGAEQPGVAGELD